MNKNCPNCDSPRFSATVWVETCPDCGLHCDHDNGGPNEIYNQMLEKCYPDEEGGDE